VSRVLEKEKLKNHFALGNKSFTPCNNGFGTTKIFIVVNHQAFVSAQQALSATQIHFAIHDG
jgi:hypothetical protein